MNSRKAFQKLSSISQGYENKEIGQTFSIKEIINMPESFFDDKIFEIVYDFNNGKYKNL